MGLKVVFVLAFCMVACECHPYSDFWHHWLRYFNDDHPEESLGTCSKADPCGAGKICCLNNHQGHCFKNRLTISNSDICLTDAELALTGLDAKCQNDADCDLDGTWCEYSRSNKWGKCVYDLCSGINSGRCGSGGSCVVDADKHTYECQCFDTHVGADCSIDHPCELVGFDAVCGSNGRCEPDAFPRGVYPEDLDTEDTFTCSCSFGWTGSRCNHEHECKKADNPCGTGKCAPLGDSYECWCPLNTYGTNCTETCGNNAITFADLPITISSPDVNGSYPMDIECEWIVTGNASNYITLGFGNFDLEEHPTCRWDSLTVTQNDADDTAIGDGSGESGVAIAGKYCGVSVLNMTSPDETMKIIFSSDRMVSFSGFTAVIDQTTVAPT